MQAAATVLVLRAGPWPVDDWRDRYTWLARAGLFKERYFSSSQFFLSHHPEWITANLKETDSLLWVRFLEQLTFEQVVEYVRLHQ